MVDAVSYRLVAFWGAAVEWYKLTLVVIVTANLVVLAQENFFLNIPLLKFTVVTRDLVKSNWDQDITLRLLL